MILTERGAAEVHIKLTKGVITVRHTNPDGPILQQWTARPGDWERLWQAIMTLKTLGGPTV